VDLSRLLVPASLLFFFPQIQAALQPAQGVSRELARERARVVSDVSYRLNFQLVPGAPRLQGHADIDFQAVRVTDALVLDFRNLTARGEVIDGTIHNLKVNGAVVSPQQTNGHILLPAHSIRAGKNSVELDFESEIALANRAITRYVDHDDGQEYLYTLFVPMDASLAFPCFDQPALKARFTLDVLAPANWTVISNAPVESKSPVAPASQRSVFQQTAPISTYLFAFAAGPFRELPANRTTTGAPLRLLVRQSKFDRAKQEWPAVSTVTQDGMRLLGDFFGRAYPFPKYDQVLIPGLAYGGMEHAGATFLREESVLFRSVPTEHDKTSRSILILHELAHQWFGDLVTMRWFDDLWLKEGFAQYMAYHTLAELKQPDEIWQRFYNSIKPAAYGIDATLGTTPIFQEIPNLKDAKSAYGAIVYNKAPGILRSLEFVIGETAFRDGIRMFVKQHAFGNAQWSDLVDSFGTASGRNLRPWAAAWVQRRGMPEITVDWSCGADKRLSKFNLSQRNVLGEGGVWPIKMKILLGYGNGPPVFIDSELNVERASVPSAIGKPCPEYVFANDEDRAYGRFPLDSGSVAGVEKSLPGIADPFLKSLLWGGLWDTVREAQVAPLEFISTALAALPREKDTDLTLTILNHLRSAFIHYLSDAQRASVAAEIESLHLRQMQTAPDLDLRIAYFRSLIQLLPGEPSRLKIKELLTGKAEIPGIPLKPVDRWNMIGALFEQRDPDAATFFATESARDRTDDGRKYAYSTQAAAADPAVKRKYFEQYLNDSNVSEDWVVASLPWFNAWTQLSLTTPYVRPALEALPKLKRERKIFFVVGWLNSFVRDRQSPEMLQIVNDFVTSSSLDTDLRLKVLQVKDELERTVRIRAKYAR
jgi:aminopeptidase N